MSISKRKIGHYYLKLHDKENEDICYPNSTIINLLNFLNDVEKIDKLKSMPTQHKFYFLNPISIKPHIANLTFTNAKTYHSPDLISEQTLEERPNPKELYEGELEKTHAILKYSDDLEYIILLFEERRSGLGITRAINYLNYFADEMFEVDDELPKYDIEHQVVPGKEFIDALAKFGRITIGRIIFDKNLLPDQTEFLDSTSREQSIRNDIELTIKAEKYDSIKPGFMKDNYTKHMLKQKTIKRILLEGKSTTGNPFKLDTDNIKEYNYVDVEIDEETGIVNSASIFSKLNDMIGTMT